MSQDDVMKILRDHASRIAALEKHFESPASTGARVTSKKQSAKEFLISKAVVTETQKVLALSYYLERAEGVASFNVPDLEAAFRAAREKLPKNMNDAVNKNVARGFIMETAGKKDSKKAWQLTATGERFVEEKMGAAS